jgi:hypothetical protein
MGSTRALDLGLVGIDKHTWTWHINTVKWKLNVKKHASNGIAYINTFAYLLLSINWKVLLKEYSYYSHTRDIPTSL